MAPPRLLVDERELAEMLTRTQHAQNHLPAILSDEHDLHTPVAHDEQRVAPDILEQNDADLSIALLARRRGEARRRGGGGLGEERSRPQEVGYLHQSEGSAKEQGRRKQLG